jgi:hypothetical protein
VPMNQIAVSSASWDTDYVHEGTHSLYVYDFEGDNAVSVTQMVKAAPGVNYRVTARVRDQWADWASDGSWRPYGRQYLYLEFVDKNFQRIPDAVYYKDTPVQSTPSFQQFAVQQVSPPGTAYVRIFVWGPPRAQSEYVWDDVRLTAF